MKNKHMNINSSLFNFFSCAHIMLYIVLTEEIYGGDDKIGIFDSQKESEKYSNYINKTYQLQTIIKKQELEAKSGNKVYSVITREPYGGKNTFKIFKTESQASEYAETLNDINTLIVLDYISEPKST